MPGQIIFVKTLHDDNDGAVFLIVQAREQVFPISAYGPDLGLGQGFVFHCFAALLIRNPVPAFREGFLWPGAGRYRGEARNESHFLLLAVACNLRRALSLV